MAMQLEDDWRDKTKIKKKYRKMHDSEVTLTVAWQEFDYV